MLTVAAFYRFTPFDDPTALRAPLRAVCAAQGVTGTILLALEGVNGTVAGPRAGIDAVLAHLRTLPGCAALSARHSTAAANPFPRLKVRVKREIVTMGQPGPGPAAGTGHYVSPDDWNALIVAPDVAVIDTRNGYEVALGTFRGALDPGTESFGAFPDWWRANADRFAGKRIAMFCTGGIRCEKATAWLVAQGVPGVHHLRGGILGYLETVPPGDSLWQGDCFVFDGRVSVGHGLVPGAHALCHGCRRPLMPGATENPDYEAGVACPACAAETTEADKARFRERQRQMTLARARVAGDG